MHVNMLTISSIFLMIYASLDLARAVPLARRDVVDPPVTSPTAGTVWNVGETQTVTWNTSDIPSNPTTTIGMLILGYLANNSENLNLSSPLASGFKYTDGQAQITVPDVPTRSDYIVVLFGDSGNASPQFTIINSASSSTPPTSSSASRPVSPSSTPTSPSAASSSAPPESSTPGSPASSGASSPASPTTTSSPVSGNPISSSASATSPVSSARASSTPASSTAATTGAGSPTQTNAAWRASRFNTCSLVVVFASIALFI